MNFAVRPMVSGDARWFLCQARSEYSMVSVFTTIISS
jgi:hypothetical protein